VFGVRVCRKGERVTDGWMDGWWIDGGYKADIHIHITHDG